MSHSCGVKELHVELGFSFVWRQWNQFPLLFLYLLYICIYTTSIASYINIISKMGDEINILWEFTKREISSSVMWDILPLKSDSQKNSSGKYAAFPSIGACRIEGHTTSYPVTLYCTGLSKSEFQAPVLVYPDIVPVADTKTTRPWCCSVWLWSKPWSIIVA